MPLVTPEELPRVLDVQRYAEARREEVAKLQVACSLHQDPTMC